MNRKIWSVAMIIATAATVSSCASLNINALPQPGKTYSGGYDIALEFDNVLNLPDHAKVVMDGTQVGVVAKMTLERHHVDLTARIDRGVAVPSNVHPALQQATVLGDIYVALDRPEFEQAAAPLPAGARIPLTQTTSPPQLEETMAHLADFVLSGSIQRVQSAIIGINRVTPQQQTTIRRLASQVATDLSDASNNIDVVNQLLNGTSGTGEVAYNRMPAFQYWFSPKGMLGFSRMSSVGTYVGRLLPALGSTYSGGYWLAPFLNSLANAISALQRSKWAFEDEWPAWRRLFTDFFLPQDKYPAINIASVVGPDGRELSGNVADVLRILGAAP